MSDDAERVGPVPGSEPEGPGFGRPWKPQPGVTLLAENVYVRSVIELEPGPPSGLVALDVRGKWNHGARDTLSIITTPEIAVEWARLMVEAAAAAPGDAEEYVRHRKGDNP